MEKSGFFHSVRLDESKCMGCTNCIKRCPTGAIRVRRGKAYIISVRRMYQNLSASREVCREILI